MESAHGGTPVGSEQKRPQGTTYKTQWRETLGLRAFGFAKIPLLLFCTPSVVELTEQACAVKVPLNWRTRNHLGSMYFGALAVGADCAGGLLALSEIRRRQLPLSIIFKDSTAVYLRRPTGDVVFRCTQGDEIRQWVDQALTTGERVNGVVHLIATVPQESHDPVAKFDLTLSLKRPKNVH